MSMTMEEAIALLNEQYETCKRIYDCSADQRKSYPNVPQFMEALDMALSALRGPTREQVEKVWKPCKVCNGKTTLYQHTNTTKLFMNTFGKATTLVTECNGCPPYADCCMKGISMNSAFRISYCPECGRPLTDKAVDTIMKRMEEMRND